MNYSARSEEIKKIFTQPISLAEFVFVNTTMVICPEEVATSLEGIVDESGLE